MPLCVECGKPLKCPDPDKHTHASPTEKGCALKKCALWVHVMDDRGNAVKDVKVSVVGEKPTPESGFARFDELEADKKYTAKLSPLTPEQSDEYDAPDVKTQDIRLAQGEIGYLNFVLKRRPQLKVKVVKKKTDDKLLRDATVTVSGPGNPGDKPTSGGGADYKRRSQGKYDITVALDPEDAKLYFVPELKDELLEDDKEVLIQAELINVVTPKIEAEYLVALLDRKLSAHQDGGEDKIFADATRIEISFTETNPDHTHEAGAKLELSPADAAEVYVDDKLTTKLTADLTKDDMPKGAAKKLYLKGTKAGAFKVKLTLKDPPDKKKIKLDKNPAEIDMGVVELKLEVHQQDATALGGLTVDPDTDPVSTYHTNLKDKALPDQKVMTDEAKVKAGRLLHVQDAGHHGRARLLLKKLESAQWPAGTGDYKIVARATNTSGSLAFHKKEVGDDPLDPVEFKVSDLLAAEKEVWAEGKTATTKLRDVRLDIGIDRGDAGLPKTPKRNGDWACFTVVKIKEVKLTVTTGVDKAVVWDDAKKRFYINTDSDEDGRKLKSKPSKGKTIKVTAELTEKIKDVKIHFMLVPDKDNHEKAHWGNGLPASFKFKALSRALKAKDRLAYDDVMHFSAKTDADGVALMEELVLSRFGGDKFQIGAYLDEDPHLAKYVDGHVDLSKRKPALSGAFTLWRRVWLQITRNQTSVLGSRAPTVAAYEAAFVEYKEVDETPFDVATLGLTDHEEWQFNSDGSTTRVFCIGNHNKATFHGMFVAANAAHSPKGHLVMVAQQWDPENGPEATDSKAALSFKVHYKNAAGNDYLGVFDPPLAGGNLVISGRWEWSDGTNTHNGPLADANVALESTRLHHSEIRVTVPNTCAGTCACGGGTAIAPSALKKVKYWLRLKAATGPWGGESGQVGAPHCLIVMVPNNNQFNMVIIHEVGHMLMHVRDATGWNGLPDHPDHYVKRGGQGPHCKKDATEHATEVDQDGAKQYQNGSCSMFHEVSAHVAFCDNCRADTRVRDLSELFKAT
jgi:hypothetical protein